MLLMLLLLMLLWLLTRHCGRRCCYGGDFGCSARLVNAASDHNRELPYPVNLRLEESAPARRDLHRVLDIDERASPQATGQKRRHVVAVVMVVSGDHEERCDQRCLVRARLDHRCLPRFDEFAADKLFRISARGQHGEAAALAPSRVGCLPLEREKEVEPARAVVCDPSIDDHLFAGNERTLLSDDLVQTRSPLAR